MIKYSHRIFTHRINLQVGDYRRGNQVTVEYLESVQSSHYVTRASPSQ